MATPKADEPARLGLILLGASTFPDYPPERMLDQELFGNSARAFRTALEAPGLSLLGKPDVLDLFESEAKPDMLIGAIQDFLAARPSLKDVIIYYCGHGWFLNDGRRSYALMIKASNPRRETLTMLPIESARNELDEQLTNRRVVLVLDCCFASSAVSSFQSTVNQVVDQKVYSTFPEKGTTLLLASSKDVPGIAPEGEQHTMFTGALVHVLEHGIAPDRQTITLDELLTQAGIVIRDRWRGAAMAPEIQSPRKSHGDIAREPYFHNPAYRAPKPPSRSAAEFEMVQMAFSGLRSPLPADRRIGLEQIARLADSTRNRRLHHRMIAILRANAEPQAKQPKSVREAARALLKDLEPAVATQGTVPPTTMPTKPVEDPAVVAKRLEDGWLATLDRIELLAGTEDNAVREAQTRELHKVLAGATSDTVRTRAHALLTRFEEQPAAPPPPEPAPPPAPKPRATAAPAPSPKVSRAASKAPVIDHATEAHRVEQQQLGLLDLLERRYLDGDAGAQTEIRNQLRRMSMDAPSDMVRGKALMLLSRFEQQRAPTPPNEPSRRGPEDDADTIHLRIKTPRILKDAAQAARKTIDQGAKVITPIAEHVVAQAKFVADDIRKTNAQPKPVPTQTAPQPKPQPWADVNQPGPPNLTRLPPPAKLSPAARWILIAGAVIVVWIILSMLLGTNSR